MTSKIIITSTLLVFTQITCMESASYKPQKQLFEICERRYYDIAQSSAFTEADMIEYTISQGANVNAKNTGLETPLHLAARTGACHIANTLVRHGADPKSTNLLWETPLHTAARGEKDKFILTLLEHDPELITIKNSLGNTPLHCAILSTSSTVEPYTFIKWLIDTQKHYAPESNILEKNNSNKTPADLAKDFLKNEELADLITQWAFQPSETTQNNLEKLPSTLFDLCNGKLKAYCTLSSISEAYYAKILITNGAQVNAQNAALDTPLQIASRKNLYDLVKKLLKYGADPQIINYKKRTPLHTAICAKSEECIDALLTCKLTPINAKDEEGNTALHLAAIANSTTDCIKNLIFAGADINQTNKRNQTPMDIAKNNNNNELANCMIAWDHEYSKNNKGNP